MRTLSGLGTRPFFGGELGIQGQDLEEIVRAAVSLASKRIGALIVMQRDVGLNQYVEVGTRLDARVSKELRPTLDHGNCDVCGRSILKGERTDIYLAPGGQRKLVCELCIDRARIYATGHSAGSAFAGFLVCTKPSRYAAVAMVSATVPSSNVCSSIVALSVSMSAITSPDLTFCPG